MEELKKKFVDNAVYNNTPVNKYIIGKNSVLNYRDEYNSNDIKITLLSHLTYVLQNKPLGNGNESLPDD